MDFAQYEKEARLTAVYPGSEPSGTKEQNDITGVYYCALGASGEAGEIANKVKKLIRDDGGTLNLEKCKAISFEIGDALWYLSNLSQEIGFSLEQIAEENISKLASRKQRGEIHGQGDNR